MITQLITNKRTIETALGTIVAAGIVAPLLPLHKIINEQGLATGIVLLGMGVAYSLLAVQHTAYGTHKVTVEKINNPTSYMLIRNNDSLPVNLYGVEAPHPKQQEIYKDSLDFMLDLLSSGTVKIKSMPTKYIMKNNKMKFSRVYVDGVDIAEEALRQGKLWLDPNLSVPRSYRLAEDQGKTWNRGHFKLQKEGKIISPFKFAMKEMYKKQDDSAKDLGTSKKQKVTQWGR